MPDPCPVAAEWSAFALGELASGRLEALSRHLEACPACVDRLEEQDGCGDELVAQLERLGPAGEADVVSAELDVARRVARRAARGLVEGSWRLDVPLACSLEGLADAVDGAGVSLQSRSPRLGRFELLRPIGTGSFGQVLLAHDPELDRDVALKLGRFRDPGDARERERFLHEARSAASLEHSAIVSLYEVGASDDGVPFLVCEYVDGETLAERIARGALEPAEAARLVLEVGEALAYAHERGVIHRDIKPSNILLDREGRPHLADFGLAKRERADESVTQSGDLLGTPAYMSPELARGDARHVDARSDVYSLGVVLYEALTGHRPFYGNRRLLLLQVLEEDPRPPRQLDARIPRDLETICLTALRKSPGQRYAGARELAADLQAFLDGDSIRARRASVGARLSRWVRREPLAASLVSAGLFGSLLAFLHLTRLSRELVHSAALDSAAQYADMLEVVNDLYSSEVVEKVGHHDVEVTADHARRDGAIPLPATLLIELLDRIDERGSGMHGRHFSGYPYPFREDGGPHDDFEREALAALSADPEQSYYRFVDDEAGRPVLRYARPRVMGPSCVYCHNNHPDSPKRDWEVGDVRGVLEVVRSLDRDEARIRSGLRGTFGLIAGSAAFLLALGLGLHWRAGRRRRAIVEGEGVDGEGGA